MPTKNEPKVYREQPLNTNMEDAQIHKCLTKGAKTEEEVEQAIACLKESK